MMLWRLHDSVLLDCTLEQANDVCINPKNLGRLQEIMCPDYEVLKQGENDKVPKVNSTREQFAKMLDDDELPDLPWSPLDPSPDYPHATHFKFSESIAKVSGSQFALEEQNVVLFHSAVKSWGIEEWKLRVLEEVEDGKKVRVTETVWGHAPVWIMWPLKTFGIAQRQHSTHMNMYHKLLPASKGESL